jgi:phasin family protein
MFTSQETVRDFHKTQLDTLSAYGQAFLQAGEKLTELHVEASREMLSHGQSVASTLLSAKDPQELIRLATTAAQPQTEKLASYSRSAYDIANQASTEIGRVFESQLSEGTRHAASLVDQLAKAAPSGSEPAVQALKQAVSMASEAMDALTKAARQAGAAAESNMAAAVAVASDAIKTKSKKSA